MHPVLGKCSSVVLKCIFTFYFKCILDFFVQSLSYLAGYCKIGFPIIPPDLIQIMDLTSRKHAKSQPFSKAIPDVNSDPSYLKIL